MQYIGFVAFPLVGLGAYLGIAGIRDYNLYGNDPTGNYQMAAACGVLAIACPITSGVFSHIRTVNTKKAVSMYNEKY